ncbi:hypothetical protein N8K70_14690 [Microbacterium betulae]|uniref:Uncharacterized protein n=1 Tax=Microbacterium betulae TaxID=2981139 RepID=A0AA97FH82_9MICO|nr:hypothetical protein [Microbacterium sp. AB]WOF22623.1 hypothetical protein N8K70_14690 [Microbacterium sp. AB]
MSLPTRRLSQRERQPRRRSVPARLLLGALGTAGAVVLGILAGGGTFAVWTAAASTGSAATLQAGSAALSVTPLELSAAGLYPGHTVYGASSIGNTGTTPLALSLDAVSGPESPTAFTEALVVSLGTADSAAACASGEVTPVATVAVGGATPAELGTTLAPGASTVLCVGLGLPAGAPAAAAGNAASPLTLSISGTQVRS